MPSKVSWATPRPGRRPRRPRRLPCTVIGPHRLALGTSGSSSGTTRPHDRPDRAPGRGHGHVSHSLGDARGAGNLGAGVIDLHTHSTVSDGTDPPGRVVELAAAAGCGAVALTDHDTLAGRARPGGGPPSWGSPSCPAARSPARTGAPEASRPGLLRRRGRRGAGRGAGPAPPGPGGPEPRLAGPPGRARPPRLLRRGGGRGRRRGRASAGPTSPPSWSGTGPPSRSPTPSTAGWPTARPAYVPKARSPCPRRPTWPGRRAGWPCWPTPSAWGSSPATSAGWSASWPRPGFAGLEALYGRYYRRRARRLGQLAQRYDLVATGGSDHHGTLKPDLAGGHGPGRPDGARRSSLLEALAGRRPA